MLFSKKVTDNRRKNTKRKITPDVVLNVKTRDIFCIFNIQGKCRGSGGIEQIHHAYFGLDANYGPNRNEPDQLVGLCTGCHDHLHSRGGEEYREFCKNYLKNIYD